MRLYTLMIALLAATTLTAPAFAQSAERDQERADRARSGRVFVGGGRNDAPAPRPEFRAPPVQVQAPSPPPVQDNGGWRGNRGWNGESSPVPVAIPPSQPSPPQGGGRGGGLRGREGGDGGPPPPAPEWRGRDRDQSQGGWSRGPVAVAPPPPSVAIPPRPDRGGWRGPGDADHRPGWGDDRHDDHRDGWNNGGGRGWNDHHDDGRRDTWRGQNWGRDDGRYGYNQRWDRDWRSDRRYDWQRYRDYNRGSYRQPHYFAPFGYNYGYRRFSIGIYMGSPFFAQQYWLDDPSDYRLPAAYPPYRWVRYYNDVLLIDTRSGLVVDAVYDFFW